MIGDCTHTCLSPTHTVNGCELRRRGHRLQSSEQEYNDVTASNRRPSTPYCCNTLQNFSQGIWNALSRGRQNKCKHLWHTPNFSKRQCLIISQHHFSRNFVWTFAGRLRREMPRKLLYCFFSPSCVWRWYPQFTNFRYFSRAPGRLQSIPSLYKALSKQFRLDFITTCRFPSFHCYVNQEKLGCSDDIFLSWLHFLCIWWYGSNWFQFTFEILFIVCEGCSLITGCNPLWYLMDLVVFGRSFFAKASVDIPEYFLTCQ